MPLSELHRKLKKTADVALTSGELKGLVAVCFENERPLQGLAGLLDWRFQGALSEYLRAGIITGKVGECVYLPITKNNRNYHLLLIGGGRTKKVKKRTLPPPTSIE